MEKSFLTTTLILTCFLSMSQVIESTIENLVFEGVGTRGVAMVGALQALSDGGNLDHIKRVSGVSSGSIIALLYSLGYSPKEMREIFFEIDFASLEDKPCIFRVKKKIRILQRQKTRKST